MDNIFSYSSNVSVHRRRLVRRTVERLVGLFIWFSAVLLWPIVLNVTVWSLFFALSMWKVHCTCGSLLFICPTSAFTLAPLAARSGGTPCSISILVRLNRSPAGALGRGAPSLSIGSFQIGHESRGSPKIVQKESRESILPILVQMG